jgi:hypothetical protein
MKNYIHFVSYLNQVFLEWEIFETKIEKKSKHTFCGQYLIFLIENRAVYEMVEPSRP